VGGSNSIGLGDQMTTYERIENIPYHLLRNGGTFDVQYVPAEMAGVGYGMGAIELQSNSGLFYMDQEAWPDTPIIWTILLAHSGLIIGTICVSIAVIAITHLVYTIKAIPEGQIIDVLPTGDRIFQAADGSTWQLGADGTRTQLGGAPAGISTAILAGVALVIVVTVAYIAITLFKRKKDKD